MRRLLTVLFLGVYTAAFAQGEVVGTLTYLPSDYGVSHKTADTINLPISDDFSRAPHTPNQDIWTDAKVYVNNTFPTSQLSRGVATFDGLGEGGRAYDITSISADTLCDVLTSKYIDLSSVTSPFLNFMFQEGGWGEAPESGDSLVVDFWSVDSARWERVWSANARGNSNWKWATVSADHPKWLKKGFRFRIGNYGAHNGGFDVWNIDYLSLESNRTPQDTTLFDPALTLPHPELHTRFRNVPYWHMSGLLFRSQIELFYRRNGVAPTGGWSLNLGKYRLFQDGVEIDSRTSVPVVSNLDHNVDLSYTVPLTPGVVNVNPTGPTVVSMMSWFDGEAVGETRNDTMWHIREYDNYYALDDGSAERVYGLTDANTYMLYQFQPLLSDTLKGFDIYFGESENDITNTPFKLVVYSFNSNAPGSIIYESATDYYPKYAGRNNQFVSYELDNGGLYVNGTVYIGIKQLSSTPLTVGLDRNVNGDTTIIYGDGFTWYPSNQQGALMIRPYFGYHPDDISVEEWGANTVTIYPNPNNGQFTIDSKGEQTHIRVIDLNGRALMESEINGSERIDLSDVPAGMYFVQWTTSNQSGTEKILIQ